MDRGRDYTRLGDESHQKVECNDEASIISGNFYLDFIGEVKLILRSEGLSWNLNDSSDAEGSTCLEMKLDHRVVTEVKFSDVYAVEFANYGLVHGSNFRNARKCFLVNEPRNLQMYRFTVHGFRKSGKEPCLWNLAVYTFGHEDLQICQTWVDQINDFLNKDLERPKNLMVFVHPRSGKAKGCKTWETVAPIFARAKVQTEVIVTQRAGHAFDAMASITNRELSSFDGVVAIGGDGFFNEVLNGFLLSRHKAPLPPTPSDIESIQSNGISAVSEADEVALDTHLNEEHPLLQDSVQNGTEASEFNQDPNFLVDNKRFRFGLIPAGSTDAIVICTTGARDPITSALHIVLGRTVSLDAVQVVRWKTTSTSKVEPCIRYAASFAGYGFYGDVISESEKYRWMGPKRYDYVGTKVFLKHRSYEAEVMYQEVGQEKEDVTPEGGHQGAKIWPFITSAKSEKVVCRTNCDICNTMACHISAKNVRATPYSCPKDARWLKSKGRFLSIGAAVMSNRNERAPDGLVADAHLSDGFLHLILIKDCSRPMYLWHLTQLAKKGGDPLNFEFVEYHKTSAFTFTSIGHQSAWNLDGELFQAHQLSAQVFRGLVNLFASGPEV